MMLCIFFYSGLPRPPASVNINPRSTTARITWNIGSSTLNHPVDYVYVSYNIHGSGDVTSVRVQSNVSELTLESLFPTTRYLVRVLTNNLAGNSTNLLSHAFKTRIGGEN